jgi:peptide subunit release factor 1 (eRF1)
MVTAETIDRIIRFDGGGVPVISLYSPVDPAARHRDRRARVSSLLRQIRPLAKNSELGREARMSLRTDIERVQEALGGEQWPPGAIAIFSCSGRDLYEEVPLPRPVRDRVVVDAAPWARPMLAVLDEYHRGCVVVIDKGSARAWEMYFGLREMGKFADRVLRRPSYAAGLAEYRIRSRADELSRRHYRRVAAALDELFRAGHYDLLVVGGHDHELPRFVDFLTRDLRTRVAGTFSIDPATASLAEVRARAGAITDRYVRSQQQRLVGDVFEKARTGGLAALGLDDCLWAGSAAAIRTLLVQEGLTVPGVVCDESGWLARSGDVCPLCGRATRHTPDLIDELVQAVIDEDGSVRHIQAPAELADRMVAAYLRFPLPPRPTA